MDGNIGLERTRLHSANNINHQQYYDAGRVRNIWTASGSTLSWLSELPFLFGVYMR
jgi:hypothetical protein